MKFSIARLNMRNAYVKSAKDGERVSDYRGMENTVVRNFAKP